MEAGGFGINSEVRLEGGICHSRVANFRHSKLNVSPILKVGKADEMIESHQVMTN